MKNKNQNKIYKDVLKSYDIEKVEINNYDLNAKLKDKIKTNKNQNSSDKDKNKMAKKSKIDMVLEIVLEVKQEIVVINNRLDVLEKDVKDLKQDVGILKQEMKEVKQGIKVLKSEAIKHGWEIYN